MEVFLIFPKIKKFLIFWEMELFSSNTEKFQEMDLTPPPQQKKILVLQETGTLKKLLEFQEMELFSPSRENVLYFRKRRLQKIYYIYQNSCSYILGNGKPEKLFYIAGNEIPEKIFQ